MNRNQLRTSALATGAASLLLLTSAAPVHATTEPPGNPAGPPADCDDTTAEQALEAAAPELGPSSAEPESEPVLRRADTSAFNGCAMMSWIEVPYGYPMERIEVYPGAPHAVMLFHYGEYVGTATAEPQRWDPHVENHPQASMDPVIVTYSYMEEGQEIEEIPVGRAVSVFRWNADTQSVDHEGEFPPNA